MDACAISSLLRTLRVFCKSCGHAHAILPDLIIPYSSYSLFFILHVLGQYFAHISSIEQICKCSSISVNQFFKWLSLWKAHKQSWLIPRLLTRLSGTLFRKKKTIPFSHQTSHALLPIPFSSLMQPQCFLPIRTHSPARRFLLRIFPSSDHTTMQFQIIFRSMISRYNLLHITPDIRIVPISHHSQLLHLLQKLIRIKRNRLPNMNQIIIRLRQPFLCHQLLFIKLLPRS